jgi:hypothetical protein
MNPAPVLPAAIEYEIVVWGQLDPHWSGWFPGLSLEPQPNGQTRLYGSLPDQSALQGVLNRIFDLNLELISVMAQHVKRE